QTVSNDRFEIPRSFRGVGSLFMILVNLGLVAAVVALWVKLHRPAKEDPRLSKGLQLLQSKIAILEDLSDRTETQFKQLTAMLESKIKDVTTKIQQADQQVQAIQMAIEKSMEVAKIFQDKIPHQEIIERQNTIKYVKAAKLAHQGMAIEEIARQVDLSRGELEFICKVNRDQLMFSEEQLPSWVKSEIESSLVSSEPDHFVATQVSEAQGVSFDNEGEEDLFAERDMSTFFEVPKPDEAALKKLGEEFRQAKINAEKEESTSPSALHNFFFEEEKTAGVVQKAPVREFAESDHVVSKAVETPVTVTAAPQTVSPVSTSAPTSAQETPTPSAVPATNQTAPSKSTQFPIPPNSATAAPKTMTSKTAAAAMRTTTTKPQPEVRPVQFRKIDLAKNLG
ncbi:MAG: hypothetical protein AB7O96_18590, partial [Pseudobdellovibrionaceae bacterium]